MADEQKGTISVDGKEYDTASLTDSAKNIIANVQFADQEMARLRMRSNAIQTARQAYVTALKKELEGEGAAAAAE